MHDADMPTEVEREGEGTAALRTGERAGDPRRAPRRMAGLRSSRGLGRHGLETVAKPAKGFAECGNELLLAREDGPLLFGKRLQGLAGSCRPSLCEPRDARHHV